MPDLIATYAPERASLRERYQRRVPERNPLNPWDIYLHDCERTPEAWADTFMSAHYFQRLCCLNWRHGRLRAGVA